ncbi:hypothetical protein [Actinoallomurus sp. NPDC050550]|uniref:hypothetical protein n=1 Tax=Actinoallomurus sp. NPDC050550 TaxID=3154937 RepID=UPI0033CEEA11
MTDPQCDVTALERVIAEMRAKDASIGHQVHDELFDQASSYRGVPRELLDQVWARHFERAVTVLRDGRVPPPEEIDEAEVARDRVARGVSLSDGLSAFRRALRAIRDLFIAEATRHGLDPRVIVDRTTALWELTDVESLRIAAIYREAEISAALFDARRRADFLRGLLYGTLSETEIRSGAVVYGLDPSRPYRAIRAAAGTGAAVDRPARRLDGLCRTHGRTAMIGVVDDAIAGVVETKPVAEGLAVTAGLGPPTPLGQIHRSSLSEVHDEADLIEIVMLVGQDHMVAFFLNSAGVELDPGFPGREDR